MILINISKFSIKFLSIAFLMNLTFQAYANNQDTRAYELAYTDKKLNKYYKKLLAKLHLSDQIKLKKAQRQWIVFRDLDCSWSFKKEPLDCRIERTKNRLEEFQESNFFDTQGRYSSIEFGKKLGGMR